jgi:eukaryotic-like serine/threonine-protein kinase
VTGGPGDETASDCPGEGEILLFVEGGLAGAARAAIEAHLDACAICRRLVGASAPTEDPVSGTPPLFDVPTVPEAHDARVLARGATVGRYLVLSLLGQGGMGTVYAAYDPELDRRVALKVLRTAYEAERRRRLLVREARALGKLSHPNVVQIHDVGEHDGDVFVAMELVEGRSLDAWCRLPPRPGFREVLAAYVDAARGLSVAHAKGLVHRDVKPSNILRGDDGRVRVADFGLAVGRGADGRDEVAAVPPGAEGASSDERLTATGALIGTPLYMAPEQHEGARATAASDQYGFCAALYEGLHGRPPFPCDPGPDPAAAIAGLAARKKAGPPAPPPGSPVPAWIHQAIARGLAADPAGRHPSMDALIAALRDDPDARRRARRRNAAVGATASLLLGVAVAGWIQRGPAQAPCAHPEADLSGVWDEGVRRRVRAAFLGTGRPYAEATAARVAALLDGYAASYASMRREVCEAFEGGTQRDDVLGQRAKCLDRRRGQLEALTTLLADRPDAQVLDRAVESAAALNPVAYCADTAALTARVRPPEDPALRARVAAIEPQVDRLEVLHKAGKFKEGLALGEPLVTEVAAIPYAPLRARVAYWVGLLRQDGAGDDAGAMALFRDAAVSAAEGKDDVLAASAWAMLLQLVANRQRHMEEASVIHMLGPAALARAKDERVQALWLDVEGTMFRNLGDYQSAKGSYARALAIRERVVGPDHPDTAVTLNNLAALLCVAGDCPAAAPLLERAVAISEKTIGPDHPDTGISLSNLGNVLRRLGQLPRAVAVHERGLAIKERALGPDHRSVASSLTNLGHAILDSGDLPRAAALLERALAIKERALPPDHPDLASTLVTLGRTRVRLGQLDAARPPLDRARAIREKGPGGRAVELAEPLLALGELHLARGKPREAAPLLESALTLRDPEYAGEVDLALAEALWQLGEDRPRARALAGEARAAYAKIGHQPGLARAERWLTDHPGAQTVISR